MIVVADTGPLNYLILLQQDQLLAELYGEVCDPFAVWHELRNLAAPPSVRLWISSPPQWLNVVPLQKLDVTLDRRLGPGEVEAISLALAEPAGLLLVDDLDARRAAEQRTIPVIGTLGILLRGADRGSVDLPEQIDALLKLGFRAFPALIEVTLQKFRTRPNRLTRSSVVPTP